MSKFCANCGAELTDDTKFCSKCGKDSGSSEVVKNEEPVINQGVSKTNGQAIAAFVISLVGLVIFGLICGIISISMAVVALRHIKMFPNEKGKGLAIAGLVIGIFDCVAVFLFSIINVAAAL